MKARRRRPLVRPRRWWKHNINMDLREREAGGDVNWIDIFQDRGHWRDLVNTVINTGFRKMIIS